MLTVIQLVAAVLILAAIVFAFHWLNDRSPPRR